MVLKHRAELLDERFRHSNLWTRVIEIRDKCLLVCRQGRCRAEQQPAGFSWRVLVGGCLVWCAVWPAGLGAPAPHVVLYAGAATGEALEPDLPPQLCRVLAALRPASAQIRVEGRDLGGAWPARLPFRIALRPEKASDRVPSNAQETANFPNPVALGVQRQNLLIPSNAPQPPFLLQ